MRLLHGLAMASAMLIALPATSLPAAADSWKNESGHGRHHHHGHYHGGGGKQVFYDGPCRVERKWKGNGGYKGETRCPGYAYYGPTYYAYPAYHYPPVVYGYPAYGYPVPSGPSISITIPLD